MNLPPGPINALNAGGRLLMLVRFGSPVGAGVPGVPGVGFVGIEGGAGTGGGAYVEGGTCVSAGGGAGVCGTGVCAGAGVGVGAGVDGGPCIPSPGKALFPILGTGIGGGAVWVPTGFGAEKAGEFRC